MESSQTFPSEPSSVREARALVRTVLAGVSDPVMDDATLIASELVTNALHHGSDPGDEITVTITREAGSARIAVSDKGVRIWNGEVPDPDEDDESHRGLKIVASIADKVGHDIADARQSVWAELTWSES